MSYEARPRIGDLIQARIDGQRMAKGTPGRVVRIKWGEAWIEWEGGAKTRLPLKTFWHYVEPKEKK